MIFQKIRGVNDFFGLNGDKFQKVISLASNVAEKYSFQQFISPVIEQASLFERNLGDDTDVVAKELYKFHDRNDVELALRPEFTAGVVRAVCENSELKNAKLPLRLFSYGPLFRYERPQSGRYRQFHQINFEVFGGNEIQQDCEILLLCNALLAKLDIKNYLLEMNFIGGYESKVRYIEYLNGYFEKYKNDLSPDSKARLEHGKALRILDSKDENDKKIAAGAMDIAHFYDDKAREKIDTVLSVLQALNISFNLNKSLVRGLDYYTDTVFEFTAQDLESKSQKAILAGGRYDAMVRDISGGKLDFKAIGCAGGIERLMSLMGAAEQPKVSVGIIPMTSNELPFAFHLKQVLEAKDRTYNYTVFFGQSSVSKAIKRAQDCGVNKVIIVGEDEVKSRIITVKDLASGEKEKLQIS